MKLKRVVYGFFFILAVNVQTIAQDTLIHFADEWHFLDNGKSIQNGWTEQFFSTEHWKEGNAPFGYGFKNLGTEIGFSDSTSKGKYITSYFKKNFDLENIDSYLAFKVNYRIDDGIVFYVNNIEVKRDNMPEGRISSKTNAVRIIRGDEENKVSSLYFEPTYFLDGINSLAVSVHQRSTSSSDLLFDLELIGLKEIGMLGRFINDEKEPILNNKLELLDKKHQLNEERLKFEFEKNINRILWGIILVGAILFGALSFLFYRKNLHLQGIQKVHKEEKSEFEKQVKVKDQEMINYSIGYIRNKAFYKEIKVELLHLAASHNHLKSDFSKLISKVDSQTNKEEDWERMSIHFDAVYSGFLERLSQKYPSLSLQELRHCSFIKLHLDTKEISQILRVGPKSVQAARYRIKKKMQLSEAEDLRKVISAF